MKSSILLDINSALVALALITPRAYVLFSILPGFGSRTLTGPLRTGVAIAIALPAMIPAFLAVRGAPPNALLLLGLGLKEALIGLMLGTLLSLPIWIAQSIGSVLDTQRSPLAVQGNNASLDQDASALGGMLLQAVIIMMIQSGLFVAMAKIVMASYVLWPASSLTPPFEPDQLSVVIKRFGEFFWHLVVYGTPVLIPLLMIDFTFAVIGIFAPNLQVSFASSPMKCLAGMFILLIYWPTFSHYVAGDFSGNLDLITRIFQAGSNP